MKHVVKHHGVPNLEKKQKMLLVNSSNKNDFVELIHHAKESKKDLKNLQKNTGMDINKYVELYNSKI